MLAVNDLNNLNIINTKIFKKIIKIDWIDQSYNSKKIINIFKKFECDYLILDDIRAGNIFQKNLLSHGVKWLQFQNSLNINFYSNQLLYQNDLKHKKYKKFKNQKIYSGKEYIILRSEFYKKRVKFGKGIFVCFGGGKNYIIYEIILKILFKIKVKNSINILVNDKQSLKKIKKLIKKYNINSNIKIFLSLKNIQKIIDNCFLSITSSGMISHEVNSRGNKMILFSIAKNQIKLAQIWKEKGHFYLGFFNKKKIKKYQNQINKIIKSKTNMRKKINSKKSLKKIINDTKKII